VNPVLNLADIPLRQTGNGKGFKAMIGPFSHIIGSDGIGCMLHVVEPGDKAFPFHAHHQIDELFIILEGEGTYRYGKEKYPIKAGDVCAAPAGPGADRAHQIVNSGKATLKYLGLSSKVDTEVVEYPDSNKFGVVSHFDWGKPEAGGIRFIGRAESGLDYFDGED